MYALFKNITLYPITMYHYYVPMGEKRGLAEIAQRARMLTKPGCLSLIPRTLCWKKRTDSHRLSSDHHVCTAALANINITIKQTQKL